ncbi:MAG: hypothetical protein ACREJO_04630 [Phycisphaerales bacterium]
MIIWTNGRRQVCLPFVTAAPHHPHLLSHPNSHPHPRSTGGSQANPGDPRWDLWPALRPRRCAVPGAPVADREHGGTQASHFAWSGTPAPLAPMDWLRWAGNVILGLIVVLAMMSALVMLLGGGMNTGGAAGWGVGIGGVRAETRNSSGTGGGGAAGRP